MTWVEMRGAGARAPARGAGGASAVARACAHAILAVAVGLGACGEPGSPGATSETAEASDAGSPPQEGPPAAPPAVPADAVVARVGSEVVTAHELRSALLRKGAGFSGRFETLEEKLAVLDELVTQAAMTAGARERGLERDPEVQASINRLLAQRYRELEILSQLEVAPPDEEAIAERYEAERERFSSPRRARAALIAIRVPLGAEDEVREAARTRAAGLRDQVLAERGEPGSFSALARRHSDDRASARRGGDIGWVAEGTGTALVEPEVVDAIFELDEPGDVSPVVETDRGFSIAVLRDARQSEIRPLEEVAPAIRADLYRAARAEALERKLSELRSRYEVQIDDALVGKIGPGVVKADAASRPPSFPVGDG